MPSRGITICSLWAMNLFACQIKQDASNYFKFIAQPAKGVYGWISCDSATLQASPVRRRQLVTTGRKTTPDANGMAEN